MYPAFLYICKIWRVDKNADKGYIPTFAQAVQVSISGILLRCTTSIELNDPKNNLNVKDNFFTARQYYCAYHKKSAYLSKHCIGSYEARKCQFLLNLMGL